MLILSPASRSEAVWISTRLREEDSQEVAASTGHTPEHAVPLSFDISKVCYMIRRNAGDDPFAIVGTVAAGEALKEKSIGIIWMLATEDIDNNAIAFARFSRPLAIMLLEPYDLTMNYVWSKNTKSLRWLNWAGFRVLDPRPYGPFNELFHPFYMLK